MEQNKIIRYTPHDLKRAKQELGLSSKQMADYLGVSVSTFKSWTTRNNVPLYIQYSIEAHKRLEKKAERSLMLSRLKRSNGDRNRIL